MKPCLEATLRCLRSQFETLTETRDRAIQVQRDADPDTREYQQARLDYQRIDAHQRKLIDWIYAVEQRVARRRKRGVA